MMMNLGGGVGRWRANGQDLRCYSVTLSMWAADGPSASMARALPDVIDREPTASDLADRGGRLVPGPTEAQVPSVVEVLIFGQGGRLRPGQAEAFRPGSSA